MAAVLLCVAVAPLVGCQGTHEAAQEGTGPAAEASAADDAPAAGSADSASAASAQPTWPHPDLLDPDIAAIVERGTLRVAMLPDVTGVFNNAADADAAEAGLQGIDVEMARSLAASLGVQLVVDTKYTTHDQLLSAVLADKADIVASNLSVTAQRAAYVAFSNPYLVDHVALMANKSMLVEQGIENNPLDYLRQHPVRIGVLEGSSYVGVAERQFPQAELVLMDSEDDLVEAVADGRLFGYLSNDADFVYYFVSNPVNSLYTQVFTFSDAPENVCFAAAPGKTGLLAYLNAYLETTETLTVEDVEAYCRDVFDY